jgi:hypothetical protein
MTTALTKENQTVQAPWLEKVLKATERPMMPEPVQRTSGIELARQRAIVSVAM